MYWLLLPFSLLYGSVIMIRRWFYKNASSKTWQSPVPVIIVGNLTVGGNGKTPLVIWLVQQFALRGYRVGVVSRGYGGKSKNYPLLVTKSTTPKEAGDEPVLLYQRTKVPVAVAPKRALAVQALLAEYPVDLIISDDGLQHYALGRDVEIVVIDSQFVFGNGKLLPAGPLRESQARLKSADLIVINGAQKKDLHLPSHIPNTTMTFKPGHAVNLLTNETCMATELPPVSAMAGIGHPNRFFTMLKSMGVPVKNCYSFADHYDYTAEELRLLTHSDEVLLMTEKDAVKCRSFAEPNWWYLPIEAEINSDIIALLLTKIQLKQKKE